MNKRMEKTTIYLVVRNNKKSQLFRKKSFSCKYCCRKRISLISSSDKEHTVPVGQGSKNKINLTTICQQ